MKKLLKLLLILSILFLPLSVQAKEKTGFVDESQTLAEVDVLAESQVDITIHYFMEYTCPNCKQVTEELNAFTKDKDHIKVIEYDVLKNNNGEQELFFSTLEVFGRSSRFVPYMVIGSTDMQGTVDITSSFKTVIEMYEEKTDYVDFVDKLINNEEINPDDIIENPVKILKIPLIGEINLEKFSLILGAIVIGLIDGFNPCAMWVLLFLITMLINLKDRKRIWILGSAFILTSGAIYYLIMMSWMQFAALFAAVQIFQIIIGILAIIFAFFSIRHYWQQRKADTGCEVTSAESKRKLMDRAKRVIGKNNLWLAIVGIMGIAVTVNIIELACSLGLPVAYTSMLALQGVSTGQSALYILVYVLFFLLDDILVFSIAVITLRVTGISSKYAKYSSLIGGLIMLALGIILIFFPQFLF